MLNAETQPMTVEGNLRKMHVKIGNPIQYKVVFQQNKDDVAINPHLGKKIKLEFDGRINCVNCNKKINKPFGQGFCFQCFSTAANNAECIISPNKCEGHLGRGRDANWELENHVKPHFVYLANTGGDIKVGVTRDTQIPTRWIDQGATHAITIAKTPYRKLAGLMEVHLMQFFTDRTNWRKMLSNDGKVSGNLIQEYKKTKSLLPDFLNAYYIHDAEPLELLYPSLKSPQNVKSINLIKTHSLEGQLTGIKGQYLIVDNTLAINLRSHSGFFIKLSIQ